MWPSLFMLSFCHGRRRDGRNWWSSSICKTLSTNANSSGQAQTIEQLWEEYSADSSQWWENRVDKNNAILPDLQHKARRNALWIDGWLTSSFGDPMLKLVTPGQLQPHVGYHTQGSQDSWQLKRGPKNNNGKGNSRPTKTGELCNMYIQVLEKCFKQKDLVSTKRAHDCITKSGVEQNTYVANNLLRVYIKCGKLQDARQVLDTLVKKNVISWNTMIGGYAQHNHSEDAIEVFNQMVQAGAQPDEITYLSILKACASPVALKWGKEVHAHIRHGGFQSDVRVGTALLKMYTKCGSVVDARRVFDKMVNHDIISWNVMIGGYAKSGCGVEAYGLFLQMQWQGFKPDAFTYASILNACASAGALEWVKEVHNHALKAGLESDMHVGNSLIHMYARSGSLCDARLVFDRMVDRDVITWNVMIGGLAQHGFGHEAFSLFLQMQRGGILPNATTYVNILNPRASAGALKWVKEVHRHASKAGFELDVRVGSAFVHMYAKSGSIDDASQVFNRMVDRNIFTWTMMIGGLAEHGLGHEAYSFFVQMQRGGFVPNAATYLSILNPCASVGALEWVKDVHSHAQNVGFGSNMRVCNAFVHMYAKCGSIEDAQLVFDTMVNRDIITWTVMIGGLAEHGLGHEALQMYERMRAEGLKPDGYSFVAVLSACSHAGLVGEGRRQFLTMTQDYGLNPSVVHYNCMVDLLGRGGHLEEAKLLINSMPLEPNAGTWGALLGACRTYGNVELAELAAKELLKLQPEEASAYVALSNIYAAAGNWNQVSSVRSMMQERGIRKEPGCSWIEVDNKIHHFVVGDTSHPEAKEIYVALNMLTKKLKAEGYIPDTRLVLQNIDEEDKELALCSHSEKLAIAYGLMHMPPGKPIRIYKNLRVCSDCHTATKFISKVTGREILARDANRYHHFKDGICSCGDYW